MNDIRQSTKDMVSPTALREKYGDAIGMDVWRILQIVDKNDKAIITVITAMDALQNESQRKALIDKIWERHYQKIANSVIAIN